MSELKYQLMLNKDMSWVPCYLKSEADKVIADLIEKNERLACKDIIMAREAIKDVYKELRHSNYKRCLAMAKRSKAGMYLSYECDFKREWWNKWQKRWLELAEKFKDKGVK